MVLPAALNSGTACSDNIKTSAAALERKVSSIVVSSLDRTIHYRKGTNVPTGTMVGVPIRIARHA